LSHCAGEWKKVPLLHVLVVTWYVVAALVPMIILV
jgi:hypothetical protein